MVPQAETLKVTSSRRSIKPSARTAKHSTVMMADEEPDAPYVATSKMEGGHVSQT